MLGKGSKTVELNLIQTDLRLHDCSQLFVCTLLIKKTSSISNTEPTVRLKTNLIGSLMLQLCQAVH